MEHICAYLLLFYQENYAIFGKNGGIMNVHEMGQLLRLHRKAAGLTQKELADLAGVGKTVVFEFEKGKESVQLDTLLALSKVLNLTFELKGPLSVEAGPDKEGG